MSATEDTVTMVRANGRRLAKQVWPDGRFDNYDQAKTIDLFETPLTGLGDVEQLLRRFAARPDFALVRGGIADPTRTRGVRRLLHADHQTGDRPTLIERDRRWLAIDIDRLTLPPELAAAHLASCGELAIAALPKPFGSAAAIVQATAGHGIKPGAHLRLWFWLSRPVTQSELRYWLGSSPVDPAVFRPAQLIFTAAPIFAGGAVDPLPCRIATVGRPHRIVAVPSPTALIPPARRKPTPPPTRADTRANRYAFRVLSSAVTRIAGAQGRCHLTLVSEALRLSRLINRGLLSESDVRAALTGAVRMGRTNQPARDDEAPPEVEKVVAWTLAHCQG
jgi:hypothetical protein